jgi:hypothetical protein
MKLSGNVRSEQPDCLFALFSWPETQPGINRKSVIGRLLHAHQKQLPAKT